MANLLYVVVYPAAGSTPIREQIVAGQDATGAAALYATSLTKETSGDEVVDTTAVLTSGASYKQAAVWYDGSSYSNVGESVAWTQDSNQSAVTAGVSVPVGIGAASLVPGAVSAEAAGVSVSVGIGSATLASFTEILATGVGINVGIGSPALAVGAAQIAADGVSVDIGIGSAQAYLYQQYAEADGIGLDIDIGAASMTGGALWTTIADSSTTWTEI